MQYPDGSGSAVPLQQVMRLFLLFVFPFLTVAELSAQTTGLMLSQKELEKVMDSPQEVDRLIGQFQQQADSTEDLATKISCLQTIVLLEPHAENSYCVLLLSYDRISSLLMSIGLSEDAMSMIHRTLYMWRLCEERNPVMYGTQLGKLGSFHLLSGNKDSALHYFRLALPVTEGIHDPVWHAAALNNMGIVWDSLGNADSSYTYYNAAIFGLNPDESFHRHLLGSVTDNLANWHLNEEDARVALQLFADNVERYTAFADTVHTVKSLIGKARALWKLEDRDGMMKVLQTAMAYMSETPPDELKPIEQRLEVLELQRRYYRHTRDMAQELKVMDDLLKWQSHYSQVKSETQKLMIGTLNRSEVARMYRELELRTRLASYQDRVNGQLRWIIPLLIMAGLSILMLGYQLMRKR